MINYHKLSTDLNLSIFDEVLPKGSAHRTAVVPREETKKKVIRADSPCYELWIGKVRQSTPAVECPLCCNKSRKWNYDPKGNMKPGHWFNHYWRRCGRCMGKGIENGIDRSRLSKYHQRVAMGLVMNSHWSDY